MKIKGFNKLLIPIFTIALLALFINPYPTKASTELTDGTYTINYTVLHSDNDSASMANDYWEKPAKVIVENGKMKMQMTINHSSWVTEFNVPSGGGYSPVNVISTDSSADKRTVQFNIDDLSKPLTSKIHVTVKDIDYDHDYTIRFSFDTSSIKAVSTEKTAAVNSSEETKESNQTSDKSENVSTENTDEVKTETKTENPQTGDTAMSGLFLLLFIGSGAVIVSKFGFNRLRN